MKNLDLLVIGATGNTHIASSLRRAADELGLTAHVEDTTLAHHGPRLMRAISWRLGGRRPLRLGSFSRSIQMLIERKSPKNLFAVGPAAMTRETLRAARGAGVNCMTWCTDDPWNKVQKARWHLAALAHYDVIFTPRRSNIEDFYTLGCKNVHYLPFGFDTLLFGEQELEAQKGSGRSTIDVLFVGGADDDRCRFFQAFSRSAPPTALVGGYWERYSEFRGLALGQKTSAELRQLTISAAINLILVRRANRDGHTMRTFEAGAIGGCLIVEDTAEHREIFGTDGENVRFFASPDHAARVARELLADPIQRARLAGNVKRHIQSGRNSYADRLRSALDIATRVRTERQRDSNG